jgi:multiple sugar transport system permease protein
MKNKFIKIVSNLTWKQTKYLLVLPAIVFIVFFLGYPVIYGIYLSFTDFSLLKPGVFNFVSLSNYLKMFFKDELFWLSFKHSVTLTGFAVAMQYILGLGFALCLNQKLPGIGFFRSFSMITWVIPIAATVVLFRWLVTPNYGLINIIFLRLGLPQLNTYWFGSIEWAPFLIIIMHVWRNFPFYGVAILASIQAIPEVLYEAAKIDGASKFQSFLHITLPGIRHTSAIMIILHIIFTFNNFDFVFLSTGGGPVFATEVLPTHVYTQSWLYYSLGYAASIGVVMMVILSLFTFISLVVSSKK